VAKATSNQVFRALQQAGIDVTAHAVEPREMHEMHKPDGGTRELPPPSAEFMRLYLAIDALRTQDRPFVLQFVAASSGEGTSTVAAQFARTAALERRRPVLVVDCAGGEGERTLPGLMEACSSSRPLLELSESTDLPGCHNLRLSESRYPLLELDAGALQHAMGRVRAEFPIAVLDCAAIGRDPQSAALGRFCDGTVLVVCAEAAHPHEVQKARDDIVRHGGQLLGVAFNRWRSYIPEALSKYLG
jgi:Mrp family chromosome partitioning ATPase